MQGVTTVTSSPMSLSPFMRLENRIFIPDTWLNGLGSTKMAIFRAPPSEKGMDLVEAQVCCFVCLAACTERWARSGRDAACLPTVPRPREPVCMLLRLCRQLQCSNAGEHLGCQMPSAEHSLLDLQAHCAAFS